MALRFNFKLFIHYLNSFSHSISTLIPTILIHEFVLHLIPTLIPTILIPTLIPTFFILNCFLTGVSVADCFRKFFEETPLPN